MPVRRPLPLLAAALVLIATFAGCLGEAAPAPSPASTEAPAAAGDGARFGPSVPVDTTIDAAEPSIKVAPDGTIYVTAPTGLGGTTADVVWRSKDGGATFERLPTPDPVFGGGDSDVAVDAEGRLYQTGLWLGCVSAATTTDGARWAMNPLVCGVPVDDRNWIVAPEPDLAYLTFGSGQGLTRQTILVTLTVVGDLPVATNVLQIPDSGDYQWPGNLAVDPVSGAIYIAYLTSDEEAAVFRSTDGGKTAEKLPVAKRQGDTFDSFAVVTTDNAGNVYFTWSEREAATGTTGIYVTHSTDQGATWSTPQRVNTNVSATSVFPWIVAGDAGRVAVAYYGTNATGESAETVDGAWHVYVATSLDGLSENATWTETRATADPVIKGSICTSGTGCAAGTRDLLDYFQIALDAEGYLHAAWAQSDGENGAFVVYGGQVAGPSLLAGNATAAPETEPADGNGTARIPLAPVVQARAD